jgi:hypothetical protein
MNAPKMVLRQAGTDKLGLAIVAALLEPEQIGAKGPESLSKAKCLRLFQWLSPSSARP